MDQNEGLDAAARRELEEETGVTNRTMVQTGAYGGLDTIVVAGCTVSGRPARAGRAGAAGWFHVAKVSHG